LNVAWNGRRGNKREQPYGDEEESGERSL